MNSGWFFVIFLTIIKLCLSDESGGLMGVNIAVTSLKVKSYDAWLATRQKMSVEAQKAMMHASGTTQWIAFQQLPAKSTAATEKPSNVVHELSYLAGDGAKFNDFHPLSLAEGGYYYTAASQGHVDGDLSTAMTMKNLNISFVQGWQELLLTHRPGDIFTMSTHRSLSFSQWQEFLTTPMKHLDTSVDKQDQTLSVFESIFVRSGVQLVMAGVVSDRLGVTIILFCFFGQNEQSAEMFSHSYQDLINVKLNKWFVFPHSVMLYIAVKRLYPLFVCLFVGITALNRDPLP